ncbi:Cut8-domain-containing protein [Daldinia loculata]|uniref:Cut8-domain-containing protein n=1 Tax=Daldinia loculata TaxID=103429 RepID=UPI0020C27895|nr:Cut8-domain-containing protein [Daldinia loculata]KAI1641987.1 Cut8-domain-containing protein [Daldinia loculata]
MNVLLSPQPQPPSFFPHQHETNRRSPTRSISPFHNTMASNRKRKADDDGDEMSVSPLNSPAAQSRQLAARPSKKVRANELAGRPLSLPRLLETLDITQLRTVLQTICERQAEIGEEVVKSAPKPSVDCALQVLKEYQDKLRDAFPYGDSSSDYTYYRVKHQLMALIDALADFTHQFLPPNETSANLSLQYLDGATKVVHSLPDWESQSHRHHKENVYYEISQAWALVINEASKKGAGFLLHSGGWDQKLAKHNQQSGGRLGAAISSMAANVGWVGGGSGNTASSTPANQSSILDQLMAGNYGAPVPVGRW